MATLHFLSSAIDFIDNLFAPRTQMELQALSDKALADLGMHRSEIVSYSQGDKDRRRPRDTRGVTIKGRLIPYVGATNIEMQHRVEEKVF